MGIMTDKAAEWVSKNMTSGVADTLANKIYGITQSILTAPFDICLNLVEILQDKKYRRYIIVIWGIVGASVLVLSALLTVLNSSFPINAWGLGVGIASAVVLLLSRMDIRISVSSDLSKEINDEILSLSKKKIHEEVPAVVTNDDSLDEEELLDDDDELLDDDDDEEELLDDGEELLDDDDDISDVEIPQDLIDSALNSLDEDSFNDMLNNADNEFM